MEVTKEKFNKLKQLDRIEYRQVASNIQRRYVGSLFLSFIGSTIWWMLGFIILAFSSYNISKELFVTLAMLIKSLTQIILWVCVVLFIGDLVRYSRKKEEIKELNTRFFKEKK